VLPTLTEGEPLRWDRLRQDLAGAGRGLLPKQTRPSADRRLVCEVGGDLLPRERHTRRGLFLQQTRPSDGPPTVAYWAGL
jgi:hypothetical protein